MRPAFVGGKPLVINKKPRVCPDCGSGDHIASVLRDRGSELYCTVCLLRRWPNPAHPRGRAKAARLSRTA